MLAFLLVVLWMGAFGRAETPVKRQRGVPRDPFHQPVGQARMYQHYSYANLSEKMLETLDGSCTWKHSGDSSAVADLSVEVLRPSPVLVQRWQAQPPSQTWFDPSICVPADKFFHQVVGCTKGPALHPDCPRCHRERTEKVREGDREALCLCLCLCLCLYLCLCLRASTAPAPNPHTLPPDL